MKRIGLHILWLVLLLSGCSKGDFSPNYDMNAGENNGNQYDISHDGPVLATGTFRIREGEKTVRIDAFTLAWILNPSAVSDIPDSSRMIFEYTSRSAALLPDFCTEAIHVLWASPIEEGTVSQTAVQAPGGDPMAIETDWLTSLEDGFLTIHYSVYASGSVLHTFTLAPGKQAGEYFLLHDAHGDQGGDLTDGLICFPVSTLLPQTDGETVTLTLDYLNLQHTRTRLTVDYRSPA